MIREIACTLRGDNTRDIILLNDMPSISIDLPKTKHGYDIQAEEVFWVCQGILRSTDLRDSMDEQCIADIAACITGGKIIPRSKDALDKVYTLGSSESERISNALEVYGSQKFAEEFKYCIDEIIKISNENKPDNLRKIIFKNKTTNAFPSFFAIILIAIHKLIIQESKKISDYSGVKKAITNLNEKISKIGQSPDERNECVEMVKAIIKDSFVEANIKSQIYGNHATTDIESYIRRSDIELSDYELKQGLLKLSDSRDIDENLMCKVINTICAIANNGPNRIGKVIIGVTDNEADAKRIKDLDNIEPRKVGKRFVVGVNREAKVLNLSAEEYYSKWKNRIKNSQISEPLKNSVMSHIDCNTFYGLGIIVITIPSQKELSYVGEKIYWRHGDTTEEAKEPKTIVNLTQRFN